MEIRRATLQKKGIAVSLFIDPVKKQIKKAKMPKNVEDVVTALEQFEIPYEKLVLGSRLMVQGKTHMAHIFLCSLA